MGWLTRDTESFGDGLRGLSCLQRLGSFLCPSGRRAHCFDSHSLRWRENYVRLPTRDTSAFYRGQEDTW